MTAKLSDGIRKVYTELYGLHEKYQDMEGTVQDYMKLSNEIVLLTANHQGAEQRLAKELMLGLYCWFDKEQKLREDAARVAPEQISIDDLMMEDIAWT